MFFVLQHRLSKLFLRDFNQETGDVDSTAHVSSAKLFNVQLQVATKQPTDEPDNKSEIHNHPITTGEVEVKLAEPLPKGITGVWELIPVEVNLR